MNADYITDVEYTGEFHQHLAPAWLSYIAAINGVDAPDLSTPFRWCDLGCGKGVTSLLLAATHPNGEFHACDFNSAHVAYAERLRDASQVANVRYEAKSFAQMLDADLASFDFIVLHGVYSWVPDAVRAQIREFIRRRLKPGGLVTLSYNAMPGWAALQPIRGLMRAYAEHAFGSSLDKASTAFARVQSLAQQGAGYFAASPAAVEHLREIAQHDIRYVAHEYLTPHGDPFYFAEVERDLRSIGLEYAGSMTPEDNDLELMPQLELRRALAQAPTRSLRETQHDFILNTRFRRDLYAARPAAGATARSALDRLAGLNFGLADLPERLGRRKLTASLQQALDRDAAAVRAVHAGLARGAAGARDIHRCAGKQAEDETARLIRILVAARHLLPCSPVQCANAWLPVNTASIDAGIREQQAQVALACSATGLASYCEVVFAAAIEAAARCPTAEDAADHVLARLRRHAHPLLVQSASGEKTPATDEQVRTYASATWHSLRQASNADARFLRLLGLLETNVAEHVIQEH